MDDRFTLSHPITNSKSNINDKSLIYDYFVVGTFKHWRFGGDAIFLRDKTVLVPRLIGQVGHVYAKEVSISFSFID